MLHGVNKSEHHVYLYVSIYTVWEITEATISKLPKMLTYTGVVSGNM